MIYVDTDFLLALGKQDDWLKQRAEAYLEEHQGEFVTSLPTFLELFFVAERYGLDRTQLIAETLELVQVEFSEDVLFEADELVERGFTVFDAFHAAAALLGGHQILSSDRAFDGLPVDRIRFEPDTDA